MIIKDGCYKGTNIYLGHKKRELINSYTSILRVMGFQEIHLPIIQHSELFKDKVGIENNNLMYNFKDRGNRDLCLAPEYTSVCQELAKTYFKNDKDVKLFYVAECFRGEKPQKGRYRQFTQLGVEILNPVEYSNQVSTIAEILLDEKISTEVKRGLDYYTGDTFEVIDKKTGLAICGGGSYDGGTGFAIGIDRILNI